LPSHHTDAGGSLRGGPVPPAIARYQPANWGVVRIPLLSADFYTSLGKQSTSGVPQGGAYQAVLTDQRVRAAVAVGSTAVMDALRRSDGIEPDSRLARTLHHYLVRMSSRPTPYGLFAGAALVSWSDRSDVEVSARPALTRTRPDMKWLLGLVSAMEADPAVREQLSYVANPRLVEHAGRLFVPADGRDDRRSDDGASAISLRASRVVRRAVASTRTPIRHAELLADLVAFSGASRADVERLVQQLWVRGVLLTNLRPPLTNHDPARYVAAQLADIPAADRETTLLRRALDAMAEWDEDSGPVAETSYRRLIEIARIPDAPWSTEPPQVDVAVPLAGSHIHRAVARDAAKAAELLLRLNPEPHPVSHIGAYRARFNDRYGLDRPVRLLDLLDPNVGLGSPYGGEPAVSPPRRTDRDELLMRLATDAQRDGTSVITLDESVLAALCIPLTPAEAPRSLEVSTFVLACSAADVDAGNYQIVVGPNLGARAAGRTLGRFSDLLGTPARAALSDTHAREAKLTPGVVFAELVYLPRGDRDANVAVRSHPRDYEIVVGTTPGVLADHVIPLDGLYVESTGERLRLRWPARDTEVVVTSGHMLNPLSGPDICRFLAELDEDARIPFRPFDWGHAALLPALPRVQVGRIVLCPARYRASESLCAAAEANAPAVFSDAVAAWRSRWRVARFIHVGFSDNRLLVDLDSSFHLNGFRLELRRLRHGRLPVIQEALPNPEHAWLPGPGGNYLNELAIPVFRTIADPPPNPSRTPVAAVSSADRFRPPGSDWLYTKLYCPPSSEDDALLETSQYFCRDLIDSGDADSWFFVRYADPEPHLRLRFHGDPAVLIGSVAQRLCSWATRLVERELCGRFSLDTYEREVERYGGMDGIAFAEKIFAADSTAVVAIATLRRTGVLTIDPTVLAGLTGYDLLDALGYRGHEVLHWCRHVASQRRVPDAERRSHVRELRNVLGPSLTTTGDYPELNDVLAARRNALSGVAKEFDALARPGHPRRNSMLGAYLHMHCNRLLGRDRDLELRALTTLAQALHGLSVAPPQVARDGGGPSKSLSWSLPGKQPERP
jgi:thiopeptide-type bacteriocin biosynthesis protein